MARFNEYGYRKVTYADGVRQRRAEKRRAAAAAKALRGVKLGQPVRIVTDTGGVVEGRFLKLRKKRREVPARVVLDGEGDSHSVTPLLRIENLQT